MDLNVTCKTVKFLGKIKEEISDQYDIGLVKILQVTAKVQFKKKINLILSQIKSCSEKDPVKEDEKTGQRRPC